MTTSNVRTSPSGPLVTVSPSGPAGGDLGGAYPNPTVVALEETSTPARLAIGAIPDGQLLKRVGATVVGAGAPTCTTHLVTATGIYACAENNQTVASGYASSAEGTLGGATPGTRAGMLPQPFTIGAGGLTVTIVGDVVTQFERGIPSVRITPSAPVAKATVSGIVNSTPAFAAGNTTFDLLAPIDGTTTGGTIVQSDEAEPSPFIATTAAGGTTMTIAGDVTGYFALGQQIEIFPLAPIQLWISSRVIASPPVFGGVNTTFDLDAAINPTSTASLVYTSSGRGLAAHAEGLSTIADGMAAHAEGFKTRSSGTGTHAEGIGTVALARGAHAEGWFDTTFYPRGPIAYFSGAHAEGEATVAGDNDAHAEGVGTQALGFAAHGEGGEGIAGSDFSHVEGLQCVAGRRTRDFIVAAGGTAFTLPGGDFTSEIINGNLLTVFPVTPEVKVANPTRISSVPVFAAGNTTFNVATPIDETTTGGLCVDTSLGQYAHAEGYGCLAPGEASHSQGFQSVASGLRAHAQNYGTLASGVQSDATGEGCTASGTNSHAGGNTSVASGVGAWADGQMCLASGINAHAEGLQTTASGSRAHAEGYNTVASAEEAHAEGLSNTSSGNASHTEGFSCTASGALSHAGGRACTASAEGSFAHGYNAVSTADYATAFGPAASATRGGTFVRASGAIAGVGDAQACYTVYFGSTPGAAPGETVALGFNGASTLESLKRYLVTVSAIATKMAAGAAAPDYVAFDFKIVATVTNAGTVAFSAPAAVTTIVGGAGFVGATLVCSSTGANNFTLTFAIAGGLTTASRIAADVKFVEVLGT